MKKTRTLLILAGLAAVSVACSDKGDDFTGDWKGRTPTDVTNSIPGATSATETVYLSVSEGQQSSDGFLELKAEYTVTRPVVGDSLPAGKYTATFTADARCKGVWNRDVDDYDDILVSFDYPDMSVSIDPASVRITPTDQQTAGLAATLAESWAHEVEGAFRQSLARYSTIEDVEVSKDRNNMQFEIRDPERELHFTRTSN